MVRYFYDSYSIIECLKGNENYTSYFKDPQGITTRMNLMEVYYSLLPEIEYAEEVYSSFLPFTIEPSDGEIKEAMRSRKDLKGKGLNISYVDALGYQIARGRDLRFLTGDREFKKLPGVEFVR